MLTVEELKNLLYHVETDRVERTMSLTNADKFGEAICAFANDLPNHNQHGYLIIGAEDDGTLGNANITDEFLRKLSDFGVDGRILPKPTIFVQRYEIEGKALAVVEVLPAPHPPVRFHGKVHIRIGARKAVANEAEERILIEKRISKAKTFDALPCWEADLQDLNLPTIQLAYLPLAIDKEILEANHRDLKQQLASLRLYDLKQDKPTNAGILLFGNNTQYFFSGAYLQYVRLDGKENKMGNIIAEQQFKGNLYEILHNIDNFIKHNICISRPVPVEDTFREKQISNYPFWALRELVMNAVMHRDYESYAPIYIYEYAEKIEIHNAGYLYGSVNRNNFPHQNDYRNPIIAEAMRYLGYINRFNYGIQRAQELLAENHNPPATFNLDLITKLSVSIEISLNW